MIYLANNVLKLGSYNVYNPYNLVRMFSEKELRQEYTRLRSIAMKRLERLSNTEFVRTEIFKNNAEGFPRARDIKDVKGIAYELTSVSKFVASNYSTVRGQKAAKAEMLETLHKHKYDIKEEDYWDFIDFMNYARAKYGGKIYDSDQIANLFEVAKKKQIPQWVLKRRINVFRDNIPQLRALPDYDRKTVGVSRSEFYSKLKLGD